MSEPVADLADEAVPNLEDDFYDLVGDVENLAGEAGMRIEGFFKRITGLEDTICAALDRADGDDNLTSSLEEWERTLQRVRERLEDVVSAISDARDESTDLLTR